MILSGNDVKLHFIVPMKKNLVGTIKSYEKR